MTAFLASEEGAKEENEARIADVNGGPFFIINGQQAFSGAQSSQHFVQAIIQTTQAGDKRGPDSCGINQ